MFLFGYSVNQTAFKIYIFKNIQVKIKKEELRVNPRGMFKLCLVLK